MKNHEILCVITGMEHSGTTYLSKVLASNPEIMCGFECGFLLDDISRFLDVDPWYEWMQITTDDGHWGVSKENMTRICAAKDYYEAYHLLKKYAGENGSTKVRECFRKAKYIIDKTPRYIYSLDRVIEKTDIPFIIIQKNLCDQYKSCKKRGHELYNFIYEYLRCVNSLRKACKKYPDRILIVDYEELLKNRDFVLQKIYKFLNLSFYDQSDIKKFFQRTGLKENTFINKYGGMLSCFNNEEINAELNHKEICVLQSLENGIEKSAFVRFWASCLFSKNLSRHIRSLLFMVYRYMANWSFR